MTAAARNAVAPSRPSLGSRLSARLPRPSFSGRSIGIVNYFLDVRSELRKVVWPSREEATKLTLVVIGLSAIVGVYLGFLDLVFSELISLILRLASTGA